MTMNSRIDAYQFHTVMENAKSNYIPRPIETPEYLPDSVKATLSPKQWINGIFVKYKGTWYDINSMRPFLPHMNQYWHYYLSLEDFILLVHMPEVTEDAGMVVCGYSVII